MRLSPFAAAAATLLSVSFAAHATTVTYNATQNTAGVLMSSPFATTAGFTTLTFDSGIPSTFSGGVVANQTVSGAYAEPYGDNGNYFAVGSSPAYTGSATFMPGKTYNYFGLYWGSIDNYNSIEFLKNGAPVTGAMSTSTFLGSVIPPANGNQSLPATNEYVNFYFSGGGYDEVILSTTQANFELDNVTYGNVTPEPSSLALLGTGLLGIAGAVRRRLS